MSKIIFQVLICFIASSFSSVAYAQGKHTNQFDFLQCGLADGIYDGTRPLSGLIVGYHFTTLELGRLNTLGLGAGWTINHNLGEDPANHDVVLTAPLSIRLNKKKRIIRLSILI